DVRLAPRAERTHHECALLLPGAAARDDRVVERLRKRRRIRLFALLGALDLGREAERPLDAARARGRALDRIRRRRRSLERADRERQEQAEVGLVRLAG